MDKRFILIPSSGVRSDRKLVLKWSEKMNEVNDARKKVGGIVTIHECEDEYEGESEAQATLASTPEHNLFSRTGSGGSYSSFDKSNVRRGLKSITSGEVRWFDTCDYEMTEEIYEWAREEIMCAFQAGVGYLVVDEIGVEALDQLGLDSALRACIWKAREESLNTTFVVLAENSIVDQVPDLYSVCRKSEILRFQSFRRFARWVGPIVRKTNHVGNLWPPTDANKRRQSTHKHHGIGTFYSIARFPLLTITVLIILLELIGYVIIRQIVNILENLLQRNRNVVDKMNNATTFSSWRRNARQLDVTEGKPGGGLSHVPPIEHFAQLLPKLTRSLVKEKRRMKTDGAPEVSIGRGSRYSLEEDDVYDEDVLLQEAEPENELIASLRTCTSSIVELVNEHLYSMNHVGLNHEFRGLVDSYISALREIQSTAFPELLQLSYYQDRRMEYLTERLSLEDDRPLTAKSFDHLINGENGSSNTPPERTGKFASILEEDAQVKDYLKGVCEEAKVRYFSELHHNYGSTALCLSGGAGNAYYHLGVIKCLADRKLLPSHITGASGGALIGSFLCTRTDKELQAELRADHLSKVLDPCSAGVTGMMQHLLKDGTLFDLETWIEKLQRNICGTYTFLEAFERTGRSFTITVYNIDSNGRNHTRCLNYKTAPDVVIYSAVLASSALPRLLPAVELVRKDTKGVLKPYHSLGKFWRDGSFENEIPIEALRHLFNVQFTIVSQVEPHISVFFFDSRGSAGRQVSHRQGRGWRGGFLLSYLERLLKLDLKKWLELVREFNLLPKVMETDISSVFLGRTRGNCTLVPPTMLRSYMNIVSDPDTPSKVNEYIKYGQRMCWPKLGMIEDRLKIERALDYLVRRSVLPEK
mmetsp:Transcript_34760/g.55728  ORF Transcript_34760/g.55728 Transcript_34760/m.55728 type:complete len:871 (-) Transcript_34760:1777-4389(-)|eukprot:CAMPEP_0203746488 /NCGR_PEP_ID=MMETSP0098-20131031/1922_1 /ASSEMBLY_ACC=CAM_ASM_000208 /TAXON_ID=96639 /ORGANISM=" , Strain NY0313808BC1" /LENGTH=870 /DNA_ID=CAMNT_0050634613 /DNA_START=162 /DNA_END=2774 /DNA_ORIENTATION=+